MTQEEREESIYYSIKNHVSSTIDDTWDICNAIAEHYDFTPKVKELEWKWKLCKPVCCEINGYLKPLLNRIADFEIISPIGRYTLDYTNEDKWDLYFNLELIQADCKGSKKAIPIAKDHYKTTVLSLLEF